MLVRAGRDRELSESNTSHRNRFRFEGTIMPSILITGANRGLGSSSATICCRWLAGIRNLPQPEVCHRSARTGEGWRGEDYPSRRDRSEEHQGSVEPE